MTLLEGTNRRERRTLPSAPADLLSLVIGLRRSLLTDGGFTVALPSGTPVSGGVSVCADPGLTLRFGAAEWDSSRVRRWLQRWEHRIEHETVHLGGWLDPHTGQVVLDVVVVFPDEQLDRAVEYGRRHRQHAVFDLTNDEIISLADSPDRTRGDAAASP